MKIWLSYKLINKSSPFVTLPFLTVVCGDVALTSLKIHNSR